MENKIEKNVSLEKPSKKKYLVIGIVIVLIILIGIFLISMLRDSGKDLKGELGSLSPAEILKEEIGEGVIEQGEIIQRSINKIDFEERS